MKRTSVIFCVIIIAVLATACSIQGKQTETTLPQAQPETTELTETTTRITELNPVTDISVQQYDVRIDEAGAFGTIISFKSDENADGLQVKCIVDDEEIVDYDPIYNDGRAIAILGQDGPSKIFLRAYKNMNEGGAIYSDWKEVCDFHEMNYSEIKSITITEWNKVSENCYQFDPFSYQEY